MKKKFCCDASHEMYCDYYKRQSGGQMPVFVGQRYQRGHGLGSMLYGLLRKAVPFITDNIKNVGKNLLTTGVNIAQDMIRGDKFKEAARRHVPTALKRTATEMDWQSTPQSVQKVAPHLLKTGANVASNIIQGKPIDEPETPSDDDIKPPAQQIRHQSSSKRARRHIRRKHKDIFD
jgi:hypothetical protein